MYLTVFPLRSLLDTVALASLFSNSEMSQSFLTLVPILKKNWPYHYKTFQTLKHQHQYLPQNPELVRIVNIFKAKFMTYFAIQKLKTRHHKTEGKHTYSSVVLPQE